MAPSTAKSVGWHRSATKLKTMVRRLGRERLGTFRLLLLLRAVQWPLRSVLRPLVSRLPRDSRLIAFGASSDRFADNAAYLYLHMSSAADPKCVWVSGSRAVVDDLHQRGLAAEYRWSRAGVRVALRAGLYVFNASRSDINFWLSDGATSFNLWHGVGIKRIQRDRLVGSGADVYAAAEGSWTARIFTDDRLSPDYVLSTSPMMTEKFSAAFATPRTRCLELGYPRNDHLVRQVDAPDALMSQSICRTLQGFYPIVGYFPTWRDDSLSLPLGSDLLSAMAEVIDAQGGRLLFKAHESTIMKVEDTSGLVVLPRDADLNAYLGRCDILITDYSSVSFDYMLLRRPIMFFCPDLDEYLDGRGLFMNPLDVMPGLLLRTPDELLEALQDLSAVTVSAETDKVVQLFWDESARPGSAARVAHEVTQIAARSGLQKSVPSPHGHAQELQPREE